VKLFEAIAAGDGPRFLRILDEGFKKAARHSSQESHQLGLKVVDGRAEDRKR
jgi:hypothetical protein